MRVFVNATPIDVEPGSDVLAAVRAFDGALEAGLASGAAYVTDARGIALPGDAPLAAGSILRVVIKARKGVEEADADA